MRTAIRVGAEVDMKAVWMPLILLGFLALSAHSAHCQETKQKYVGKSGCRPELRWAPGTYSIRLDNSARTSLKAYTVDRQNLLFIVQYANDQDQCGIVEDVVRPKDASSSFMWDCVDPKDSSAPAVGTWPSQHPAVSGPAVEAWRIGPGGLTFVPIHGRVQCFNGFGSGPDGGTDLVTLSKKRPAIGPNDKPR